MAICLNLSSSYGGSFIRFSGEQINAAASGLDQESSVSVPKHSFFPIMDCKEEIQRQEGEICDILWFSSVHHS